MPVRSPFKLTLDTRSRDFQYKTLNRHLQPNFLLKEIGKTNSSSRSFCSPMDETLEHLLISYSITKLLCGTEPIIWCNKKNIGIQSLWTKNEDILSLNHVITTDFETIYLLLYIQHFKTVFPGPLVKN